MFKNNLNVTSMNIKHSNVWTPGGASLVQMSRGHQQTFEQVKVLHIMIFNAQLLGLLLPNIIETSTSNVQVPTFWIINWWNSWHILLLVLLPTECWIHFSNLKVLSHTGKQAQRKSFETLEYPLASHFLPDDITHCAELISTQCSHLWRWITSQFPP